MSKEGRRAYRVESAAAKIALTTIAGSAHCLIAICNALRFVKDL